MRRDNESRPSLCGSSITTRSVKCVLLLLLLSSFLLLLVDMIPLIASPKPESDACIRGKISSELMASLWNQCVQRFSPWLLCGVGPPGSFSMRKDGTNIPTNCGRGVVGGDDDDGNEEEEGAFPSTTPSHVAAAVLFVGS